MKIVHIDGDMWGKGSTGGKVAVQSAKFQALSRDKELRFLFHFLQL